jgi:hypothetical protein
VQAVTILTGSNRRTSDASSMRCRQSSTTHRSWRTPSRREARCPRPRRRNRIFRRSGAPHRKKLFEHANENGETLYTTFHFTKDLTAAAQHFLYVMYGKVYFANMLADKLSKRTIG